MITMTSESQFAIAVHSTDDKFSIAAHSIHDKFVLDSLRDEHLRVIEPIEFVQTTEEGKCVVEAPELNEFGFGNNLSEAITDLQAAIVELFFHPGG